MFNARFLRTLPLAAFLAVVFVFNSHAGVISPAPFSSLAADSLTVNWGTTYADGTLYYVAIATVTNPSLSQVVNSGGTPDTYYAFPGLDANTTYYGYVSTDIASGYVLADGRATLAAPPPSESFGMMWYSSAVLNWTGGINPGWTAYEYQLSVSPGFGTIAASGSGTGSTGLLTGLIEGTMYYGRARAINSNGIPTAYTYTSQPGITEVDGSSAPVSGLNGLPLSAVGVTSLTVNWATTYSGGTSYYVALATTPDFSSVTVAGPTTSSSYSFSALNANTTYYSAVSLTPESGYVLAGWGSTLAAAPSSPVFGGVWYSSAVLNWGGGINPGGTIYEYQLSVLPGFGSIAAGGSGTDTTGSLPGLSEGTTYYGRVRAVNNGGMPTAYSYAPGTVITHGVPDLSPIANLHALGRTWPQTSRPRHPAMSGRARRTDCVRADGRRAEICGLFCLGS